MDKAYVMRLANALMDILSVCDEEEFVDRITAAVSCCEYFSEDEIAEVVSD